MVGERHCVELTAVYNDGTVQRWEGWAAEEVACDIEHGDCVQITKPLRKVTVVCGRYEDEPRDVLASRDGTASFDLEDLLPDGCGYLSFATRDYRITVEAVPVEDA